jgi:phosphohistidine phosphatase SixA
MAGQVTAAEIRAILGHVDDVLLVDITRTGATAAEVQEAFTRLEGEEARRAANDTVRAVMALLLAAELPSPDQD